MRTRRISSAPENDTCTVMPDFARIERDSFGNELRLRIARIVAERQRRRARIGEQRFSPLAVCCVENAAL